MKYLQPLFFRWLGNGLVGQKRKRKIGNFSCGYIFVHYEKVAGNKYDEF